MKKFLACSLIAMLACGALLAGCGMDVFAIHNIPCLTKLCVSIWSRIKRSAHLLAGAHSIGIPSVPHGRKRIPPFTC